MKCPQCGADNRPDARFCLQCGAPLAPEAESETPAAPSVPKAIWEPVNARAVAPAAPVAVPKRFPILRILSVIYKVLGGIVAAFTILGTLGSCIVGFAGIPMQEELERLWGSPLPATGGIIGGVLAGLFVLLYGGFIALTLYGAGEGIGLFIAIEENTRAIAASWQR